MPAVWVSEGGSGRRKIVPKQYVHIKKLEEYNPKYQDRDFIWFRFYFKMVQGDPDFELIESEIDKWRYCTMIALELQAKKPIPMSEEYFERKGWDLKKRKMSLTFEALRDFIEVCNVEIENPVAQRREYKTLYKEENIQEKNIYADWESATVTAWNNLCARFPSLAKIIELSDKRRDKLKKRYEKDSFRQFDRILEAIEAQPFLIHGNPESKEHKDWRISFDWLIENDTNYLKVLEMKYANKPKNTGDSLIQKLKEREEQNAI